jgi:hypothetical protein
MQSFHLVVETLQPTLVAVTKWFLGTYTGRFNRRHKVFGHLFNEAPPQTNKSLRVRTVVVTPKGGLRKLQFYL